MPCQIAPSTSPDTSIEDQITALSANINAGTYRLLELIAVFDEQGGWCHDGVKSMANWLNWKCGTALGAAREKVRTARALQDLPRLSDAFREGRISYSKVRAITRVATPENEEFLLAVARHGTASHVETLVRNYRKVKRVEALNEENTRRAQRRVHLYEDEDGSWVIRGRLTAEQAAVVNKALEVGMNEAFHERENVHADGDEEADEPFAARRADARTATAIEGSSCPWQTEPSLSVVLVRMAEGYLNGDRPGAGGDRNLIHVRVDAHALQDDDDRDSESAEVDDCGCVHAETARRLACDASVVLWKEDEDGEILDVGRKTRTIPPAIRRAMERRDKNCCAFPGCTCRYTDGHHVTHWANGGETKLSNLISLCRHHHTLVHEGGFDVAMDSHGQPRFYRPDGTPLPRTADGQQDGNALDLFESHAKAGLEIDAQTGQSQWAGERMDHPLAIQIMLQIERRELDQGSRE